MAGLAFGENDDIQIKGASDGTLTGNVGDRLKTDSSTSPIPSSNVIHLCAELTNSGSNSMAVNGAVTPVNFEWTPPSGETWYLAAINMLLWDNGTSAPTAFGAIAGGLTNGVQVHINSNGTVYTYTNLQNNMGIALCFRDNYYVPGTSGLFETSDLVTCQVKFPVPIRLTQSTADYIQFTIRDNLSGVDAFRASALVWKAI